MSRAPHPPPPGDDASHGASYRKQRGGRGAGNATATEPGLAAMRAGQRSGVARMDDEALAGFLESCLQVASWTAGMLLEGIAEFADRRPDEATPGRARLYAAAKKEIQAALAAGKPVDPPACDEFTPDELYPLLKLSKGGAARQIHLALDLRYRLRKTLAALQAGKIDLIRARIISEGTTGMSAADAAAVEAMVLADAGQQTYVALGIAVGKAVMRVDPVGAIKRRKRGEKRARVERWREPDGTGALSGRNLPPDDTIAADQALTELAMELREAGLDGPLDFLRATALLDRLIGRDSRPGPSDRGARPGDGNSADCPDEEQDDDDWDDRADWPDRDAYVLATHPPSIQTEEAGGNQPAEDGSDDGTGQQGDDGPGSGDGGVRPQPGGPGGRGSGGRGGGRGRPGGRGKRIAAQVNLTIPLTTYLGSGHGIGDAAAFGPLDPEAAREFARSAAGHPETRWCLTVTDPEGRAVAHGCARGPQPWAGLAARDGPGTNGKLATGDGPDGQVIAAFLARLGVRPGPIAVGSCDHADAEAGYAPSRRLRHKVHARTPTCSYWGCRRPATRCDDDHTLAWDAGGLTCQCNLAPLCRRHHRMKQREGWLLEQPRPGMMAWQTPGGRRYVTTPATYLA
jgi:hypothetical protein